MADLEQVQRLKRSVKAWNQWRQDHPEIRPNLSWANLREAKLSYADLSEADLSYDDLIQTNLIQTNLREVILIDANLSRANLREANLSGANLSGAKLRVANLSGANLSGANLIRANLSGANLSEANLREANLREADLREAKLSGARLWHTFIANVDLRSVKGLAQITHEAPSMVELHSIHLPQDGSALHFLRGVGVPDEWIDFYCATMMYPIQYYSCFISYSSKDDVLAHRLHADLQANGVRCWFAPHNLKPGDYLRKEIDQAIHVQDKLLLILSQSAIKSGWVDHEVELALAREREQKRAILFPLRLDEMVLQSTTGWAATLRRTRHIGDFTHWTDPQNYQQIFDRLLGDLKKADVS